MPDFPYINARVRAMRSRLLDPGRMEELLALPTLDAFVQALNNTPYGHDLQEALARYPALQAVDVALARNFYQSTTRILSFADGAPRDLIEVVLMRWDLGNLRTILRGKHTGTPAEEIAANLMPAGSLNEAALRELAGQPDIPAVVGAFSGLEHPFAAPLSAGLGAYLETKDLFELELRLERFYAEHALRVARGRGHNSQVVRALMEAELDAINVKTAFKLRGADLSPDAKAAFFVPGGRIVGEEAFLLLADRERAEQGMKWLRIQGFPVKTAAEDLTAFERDLDLAMVRGQAALYLGDPLGIDIVIAYLALKHNEVKNLRLIARSKQLGIPRDRVRREMVVV
ncbi:MAG TPA: V-type ATPase subunit [bacterium]|nr:V-type ATPase subunit [bacterium]